MDPDHIASRHPGRAARRRRSRPNLERWKRVRAGREAFLTAQVMPNETIVTQGGMQPLVTNRRILDARQLPVQPGRRGWVLEALDLDRIKGWSIGRQHDGRPVLRLEHEPVQRVGHVPAHRFLWFAWGNALGQKEYAHTNFAFGRDRDPALVAITAELERLGVPHGSSFNVRLPQTREEAQRAQHRPSDRLVPRGSEERRSE